MVETIIEYLIARAEKNRLASIQSYDKASIVRDTERKLLEKIYNLLSNEEYEYPKAVDLINDYLYKEYGIDKFSDTKSIIRIMKLKELGI